MLNTAEKALEAEHNTQKEIAALIEIYGDMPYSAAGALLEHYKVERRQESKPQSIKQKLLGMVMTGSTPRWVAEKIVTGIMEEFEVTSKLDMDKLTMEEINTMDDPHILSVLAGK